MIHVIAIITAKSGKRDEVLGHFRANAEALGQLFEQNAIVFCELGRAPELIVLRAD